MKKRKFLMILAGLVLIVVSGFTGFTMKSKSAIAYVELETVYNNFKMKKELEAKLTNVQQMRKNILDSLKIQLKALSYSIKSEKDEEAIHSYQVKKQEYLAKQQSFEEDNQATTQAYSAQIWKQINQYTKDYGKSNGYTMILGSDGDGNLMYADEQKNITSEISDYIDKRYAGEKK
ncbi:MAG: hypothetical protein JWO44_1632 [Bacteroidetes bacterium]|nr:hypothetical protein [Bacteroidota bacterium]